MQVTNITGKPRLLQMSGVIGERVRSESEATTIFAVEPMIVPFPPKPAPNARAHQNGSTFIPVAANP